MRQLAVAETASAVDPTFEQMYTKGRPGFQIGPDVPVEDCLEILQTHMQTRLGLTAFRFNAAFGTTEPHDVPGIRSFEPKTTPHDSGPHIDEPEARRRLGIVLHDNLQSVGRVVLQRARLGVTDLTEERRSRLPRRGPTVGPKFEGQLFPGMKTVFTEGLVATTGLIEISLGPSVHDFTSSSEYRDWVRFGWEPRIEN